MPSIDDLLDLAAIRRKCTSGEARRIRIDHSLSMDDVASAVGVSAASVSRWERGLAAPGGQPARLYAELLQRLEATTS